MVGAGRKRMAWTVVAAALVAAVGCGSADEGGGAQEDVPQTAGKDPAVETPVTPPGPMGEGELKERPWEVVSNKGETYLANVFYADASENEQVMPWRIDGRVVIDRLVYPTLGNPNLFVKADPTDQLTMVLRIEPNAFEHLMPKTSASDGVKPSDLTLTENDENRFAFFLVARSARASAESPDAQAAKAGVFEIKPKRILVNAEPDEMPASLKARRTVRFVFDKDAMAAVPPGLYDARFEVRKKGTVFANVYEYQYNAVRVFERESDEYTALNVTDTQVSVGVEFKTLTADKLDDFVDAVNQNQAPEVKNAAFITFNGDLHNGGSPGTLRIRAVARTYNEEAKRIVSALKRLNLPIFLTPGNHDGYAATGHVPSAVVAVDGKLGDSLQKVVMGENNLAWPSFTWDAYNAFLTKLDAQRDGYHRDLYTGRFVRKVGDTYAKSFAEVPLADRNMVLYDGFHQWQKTYGPLYSSWAFGKNRYVSMNSYELRQHRRTGWGMYTVNYGGAVGATQLEWLDRELARSAIAAQDVTLLMHHDPRGGHKGEDFGYYFPMLRYQSVQQSTINYLFNEVFTPLVCKQDAVTLSVDERESCLHDGLQEWMAPDEEFDRSGSGFMMSGPELLKRIVKSPQVRTLLVGHAHFNTMEVVQQGEVLVPNQVSLEGGTTAARLESLETANPVRRFAWQAALAPGAPASDAADDAPLGHSAFDDYRMHLNGLLKAATAGSSRTLESNGGPRELAILRLTSAADLTSQKYDGKEMFGFGVLHVTKQATGTPRINRVTYMIHTGPDAFAKVSTVDVDRTKSLRARGAGNPVDQLFDW
ncbi:MAG: metallophosphoesterase [Deltaproteobacteria bacterium]|nr:metallophosphoesterase [Deltaproteobacteria bacterium]